MRDEFFIGFTFGIFLAGVVLGSIFIAWNQHGRTPCAKQNNVYDCEYVGKWQPKKQD